MSVQTYLFKLVELMMVTALVGGSNYSFMVELFALPKKGGALEF